MLREGVGDGQGGLVCCDLWGRKESETTEVNRDRSVVNGQLFELSIGAGSRKKVSKFAKLKPGPRWLNQLGPGWALCLMAFPGGLAELY